MKTRFKIGLIILLIIAVLAVILIVSGIGRNGNKIRTVGYTTVKRMDLAEIVSGSGTFVPLYSHTVYARVSGTVKSIEVSEGDLITGGTPLIRIDDSDYRNNLRRSEVSLDSTKRAVHQAIVNLRAAYSSALLSYSQARRRYEKNRELFEIEAVSEDTFRQMEDAYNTARVNLTSAREQLNLKLGRPLSSEPDLDSEGDSEIIILQPEVIQAELSYEDTAKALANCIPRAPEGGTVSRIFVRKGDLAAPNVPLVKIESLDSLLAEIMIDEVDIGKIKRGASAVITSDNLLNTDIQARVSSVSPVIQKVGNTRMSVVRLEIIEDDLDTWSGASCTAVVTIISSEQTLSIPVVDYFMEEDKYYVYVIREDMSSDTDKEEQPVSRFILEKREIETGIMTVTAVEVLSGLAEGDMIVSGSIQELSDKMLVEPGEEK